MVTFKTLDELQISLVAYTEMARGADEEWYPDDTNWLPVTAARVSHGRDNDTGRDVVKDRKLMKYLAEHKHFSPFEHQSATFLVEAPLFVAREWMRHRTQAFNEISMRYTSDPADTYWIPDTWRAQATKNKQSSAGVIEFPPEAEYVYKTAMEVALANYEALLLRGVAREIARAVLPTGMVTRFYATANLRNWYNWWVLRSGEGAQKEIQHYADKIDTILTNMWPDAWGALKGDTA